MSCYLAFHNTSYFLINVLASFAKEYFFLNGTDSKDIWEDFSQKKQKKTTKFSFCSMQCFKKNQIKPDKIKKTNKQKTSSKLPKTWIEGSWKGCNVQFSPRPSDACIILSTIRKWSGLMGVSYQKKEVQKNIRTTKCNH